MRKNLAKIHIWLGLLCAPYLIIFGFSSLHFNHHFGFMTAGQYDVTWEMPVAVADTSDDAALARRVNEVMKLPGYIPWWRYNREEDNSFAFNVNRPAKQYRVTVNPRRTNASVVETRNGPIQVLSGLHALGKVPGLGFTEFWRYYAYITILFVLYAAGSGIYFWTKRKDKSILDWIMLVGVGGGSVLLMIFVRIWG